MGGPEEPGGGHNSPGSASPPRHALVSYAHLEAHLHVEAMTKNPINTETSRNNHRSEVTPPQASVAAKNQSKPYSSTVPKGKSSPEAIFIIPAATMMRRE